VTHILQFSGGKDSTALVLFVLVRVSERWDRRL